MTATADNRRASRPDVGACLGCGTPLPAGSRSWRKFCSTACRVLSWDRENRPAEPDGDNWQLTPLHWHVAGSLSMLWGNGMARPPLYWRGDGCPPECRRALPPGGWSTGVVEGREHSLVPLQAAGVLERGA